jgi:LuxR family maltose regulon positive regulatory protein
MFLLRTSLVDVITPGLAAALTGRHCDLRSLEFLARGNSLIQPVAGTAAGYSYLALFREFLRAEMLYTQPALVPELHRTAAAWFAQHGQTMEAIHHAVTAGDWSLAARYLVADLDTLSLVVRRRRRQLTTLLTAMPDEVDGPQAAVVRAALALAEFDVDRCRSQLRRVRTWPNDPESTDGKAVELAGSLLQAGCAGFGNGTDADLDAVLVANSRLNAASPRSLADHPEAALLVLGCKGRVLLQRGDFAGAVAAFDDAIALAEHAGAHETLTEFLGIAALAEAIRGRLRRTGEMVAHASTLAAVGTPPELPRSALVAQAWMHTDQGDLAEAGKLVQRAEAAPEPTTADARVVAAAYALVRARLLRASGDAERATAELRAASADLGGRGSWLDQALQRAVAAIGGRGPAQPPGVVEPAAPLDTQVEGWLVQAAESVRAGETARGVLCLERALRLAAPEHLRRPFDEAPEVLRSLLLPTGEAGRRHPWLRGPAQQASHRAVDHDEPPRHDLVITAALTGKEQEVLGHLAELLTTEEIADTMFVSVNTVRSHVRSILRKLGASRRNEAVRRAWELGLLPSHED